MKKALALLLSIVMLAGVLLCGCAKDVPGSNPAPKTDETSPAPDNPSGNDTDTNDPSGNGTDTDEPSGGDAAPDDPAEDAPRHDPYEAENVYEIDAEIFSRQDGVDYGTIVPDLTYPSTVAGDDKRCSVLLPAGYDESRTYPVMYVVHGYGSWYGELINERSYLVALYGNMLARGLAAPMIIVSIDMYTDPAADKNHKTGAELKESYNKVIEEIRTDLMPFIENSFPVSTAREDTAIAGISEGAGKTLCIGFTWPEEFGWIGAFSPNAGVIPTEFDIGTIWNDPVMQEFPQLTEDETPCYLYLAVGSEDDGSKDPTLYYRDVLNEMGIRNQTDLVEGYGHNVLFWRLCFYNFFTKAFR